MKDISDLIHLLLVLMSLGHNVLGTECCSQQLFTSPAVWVPKAPNIPKPMARNCTRDPSDIGTFHSELQRGYLLLSSATMRTFLVSQKGCSQVKMTDMMLVMLYISTWKMVRKYHRWCQKSALPKLPALFKEYFLDTSGYER